MIEQEIITLVISGILLIIAIIVGLSSLNYKTLIVLILMAVSGLLVVITVKDVNYDKGQLDALKGIQKYEQLIHYEWIDSLYCPAETTYVLKPYMINPIAN